jgi:Fe-S-cluster containining protein
VTLADSVAWFKDFYRRFDEDVRLCTKVEPFWQTCQRCPDGYCCGQLTLPVIQGRNPFVAEDWWLMVEYVRDKFSAKDKKQMARNLLSPGKECTFLFGNRCSVYPNRSWFCRVHPNTISFHPNAGLFPVATVALPSCPSLAPAFGIKVNKLLIQQPQVISRHPDGRLVQLKLRKHKPLWFIDASDYLKEYESHVPWHERPTSDWDKLFALAKETGGEEGELLSYYLDKVLRLKSTNG